MTRLETVVAGPDVRLEVAVEGERPTVVLLPSAQRGAADFARLARDLAAEGWSSVAVNPRGVAGSTGPTAELTMEDLAGDVAAVVDQLVGGPAHVVGHALGNALARATATYRPEAVRSVALLACGGHDLAGLAPGPEVMEAFGRGHDPALSEAERRAALSLVFFAAGNDPGVWLDGWWPSGAAISAALTRGDWREWWLAGETVPVLVAQPAEDAMAPVAVGRQLAEALGPRATYVELAGCGHAVLPERPAEVASVVTGFLRAVEQRPG